MPEGPDLEKIASATIRSDDGMVEVTMGGEVEELRLDPSWLRHTPAHRVEVAICEVINRALADRRDAELESVQSLTVAESYLARIENEHARDLEYLVERLRRAQ